MGVQDDEIELVVRKVSKGDRNAFESLFLRFYGPLKKFTWRYVRSSHISEELVQEVFMEVWESHEKLDPEKNVRSYLYKSVKHKAINFLRHREIADGHNENIEWLTPSPVNQHHDLNEESEFVCAAQKAIENLPDGARRIYKLSRKDGLTYSEISEVLEISPKTVESQMSRALKILRRDLSKYLPFVILSFIDVI